MEEISTGPRKTVSSTIFVRGEEDSAFGLSKGPNVGTLSMLISIPDTSMWEDEDWLVSDALGNVSSPTKLLLCIGERDDETVIISGEYEDDCSFGDPVTFHDRPALSGPEDSAMVSASSTVVEAASSPFLAGNDGVTCRLWDVAGSAATVACTLRGADVRWLPEMDASASTPTAGAYSEMKPIS
jgi:hypothetical protein